jgi:hypothetical protein
MPESSGLTAEVDLIPGEGEVRVSGVLPRRVSVTPTDRDVSSE